MHIYIYNKYTVTNMTGCCLSELLLLVFVLLHHEQCLCGGCIIFIANICVHTWDYCQMETHKISRMREGGGVQQASTEENTMRGEWLWGQRKLQAIGNSTSNLWICVHICIPICIRSFSMIQGINGLGGKRKKDVWILLGEKQPMTEGSWLSVMTLKWQEQIICERLKKNQICWIENDIHCI